MCASQGCFIVNDTLVKLAATTWTVPQIIVVRGIFAAGAALLLVLLFREGRRLHALADPLVLLRCVLEGLTALSFISALSLMPIATATAILMLTPLMITAVSALFLGETVRWRRWLAVLVGFVGMLLVVRPTADAPLLPALLALAAACGVVARDLITRRLPESTPSVVIAFGTTTVTTLTGLVALPFVGWRPVDIGLDLPLVGGLAAAALFLAGGNLAIVLAFRRGPEVSVVSPYRYTVMVWAVLAGFLVFGTVPDTLALAGIGLIVASGLYTLYRERMTTQ